MKPERRDTTFTAAGKIRFHTRRPGTPDTLHDAYRCDRCGVLLLDNDAPAHHSWHVARDERR